MASGFQSSFIPKDPISPEVFKKKKTGLLGILAVSIFISSVIVAVGAVFYKDIVRKDIISLQTELALAEENIDRESVQRMIDFSQKLNIVKSIVARHQAVSGFLESLASSTASAVSFTDFSYSALTPNSLVVSMKGVTNSYSAVAFQEGIFKNNKDWKSVSFSNLALGEKGAVTFDVSVLINPQVVAYTPSFSTPSVGTTTFDADLTSLENLGAELDNL